MQNVDEKTRLDQIPVLHVRGTHTVVGYTIGRQFKYMIDNLLEHWDFFNKVLHPLYLTPDGKQVYDKSLALCTQKFPKYIEELKGIAEGAKVPFYKLFLLHIDSLIAPTDAEDASFKKRGESGCTTIMCNNDEVIMGHTEDACPEFLNNIFVVSAELLGDHGEKLEKFTTLTYAGHLPGYTMGFNEHGMVYTINTIFVKETFPMKTPRLFIARALLGASNFVKAFDILRDSGAGTSDGFSVNVHFAKQEGCPVLHNVEVGPNQEHKSESELSVLTLTHGDFHAHCNKYLRLKIPEVSGVALESSCHRHKTIGKYLKPTNYERVKEILGDQSDAEYPIFRCGSKKLDYVKTVAVGILDISKQKWSIYMGSPTKLNPVVVIPMNY